MKIHTKDKVKIIAGKDKGKEGIVLKVFPDHRVIVEGVNKVKKHVKPGSVSKEGGIISIERPISISNVMFLDSTSGKPIKLGFKIVDGRKYRISKASGEVIGLSDAAPKAAAKKAKKN